MCPREYILTSSASKTLRFVLFSVQSAATYNKAVLCPTHMSTCLMIAVSTLQLNFEAVIGEIAIRRMSLGGDVIKSEAARRGDVMGSVARLN